MNVEQIIERAEEYAAAWDKADGDVDPTLASLVAQFRRRRGEGDSQSNDRGVVALARAVIRFGARAELEVEGKQATKADLLAEIEQRNSLRAEADRIVVGRRPKLADLQAAIEADDAALAGR